MNAQLGRGRHDARIEPHLIYSPDGIEWKRLPVREPFIRCGPAGTAPGTLVTRPLQFAGGKLHLNAEARQGELRVGILDPEGKPLPGWGLEDCAPMRGDHLDHVASWTGGSDLSALAGKAVRLPFSLRQAVLYTWQFQ